MNFCILVKIHLLCETYDFCFVFLLFIKFMHKKKIKILNDARLSKRKYLIFGFIF